ncbi:MAG: phosphopantetheine-binding protein, partial [Cyclobacteriaceae bacterium]
LVSRGYVAPETETEQVLAGIWAELLGLDRVGIHDNFFELGGHSLSAIQMVTAIKEKLDTDIIVRSLFLYPDLKSQASHVELVKANEIVHGEDINSIVL